MNSAPLTSEGEDVRSPLPPSGVFWYTLANLGYGAFYAFNNFVIPLWLASFTNNAVLLGIMGGSHSFEGVFIQPIVGSISDRLQGAGGRRRPFMRLFIAFSALFLLLAPVAAYLPLAARLVGIILCIFLFTLTFNVAVDPYQALLADITSREQRGKVTGTWYFVGAFGQVLILALIAVLRLPLNAGFVLVGLGMLGTTLLTCAKTSEPNVATPPESSQGHWEDIKLALAGLRRLHQARTYMVTFFFTGAGLGAVTPFLTLFIEKITNCAYNPLHPDKPNHTPALMLSVFLIACTGVGSLAFGPLVNRFGPKRLLVLSLGLIGAAALAAGGIHTLPQVAVVLGLAGLGIGAQNASAYPLLTRLVPVKEIGFYVGLQTAAMSLAGPISVWLTGTLINHSHGEYRIIFIVCAVCILLALAILSFLHEPLAGQEVTAREREITA